MCLALSIAFFFLAAILLANKEVQFSLELYKYRDAVSVFGILIKSQERDSDISKWVEKFNPKGRDAAKWKTIYYENFWVNSNNQISYAQPYQLEIHIAFDRYRKSSDSKICDDIAFLLMNRSIDERNEERISEIIKKYKNAKTQ